MMINDIPKNVCQKYYFRITNFSIFKLVKFVKEKYQILKKNNFNHINEVFL